MVSIGEAEFMIQDEWGQGIPIPDSMQEVMMTGLAVTSVMALLKDMFEEVIE